MWLLLLLLLDWRLRRLLVDLLDDGAEDGGIDKVHEEEGLENGVGELRRLFEELGRSRRVAHHEALHLFEDVEQLGHWECGEGFGDGVGARDARLQIYTWRERWESTGSWRWQVAVGRLSLGRRLLLLLLLLLCVVSYRSCVVFASDV